MQDFLTNARPRVNGALLRQFKSQCVTLLGEVVKVDNSGSNFTIKTSDGIDVVIKLPEKLQAVIKGFVEVTGLVAENGQCIYASGGYVMCPGENIDMALYDVTVSKIHALGAAVYPVVDQDQIAT